MTTPDPETAGVPPVGNGHRELPHTADVRFEAWAPTREACIAEAITAFVATFLEPAGLPQAEPMSFEADGGTDADLLLAVLEELIFGMDTTDRVPIGRIQVDAADAERRRSVAIRCDCGDVADADLIGAVPKAVSRHELAFGVDADGRWRCTVTIDI